eukprot:2650739-Pyramimonas_sp.AAC.1
MPTLSSLEDLSSWRSIQVYVDGSGGCQSHRRDSSNTSVPGLPSWAFVVLVTDVSGVTALMGFAANVCVPGDHNPEHYSFL